MATLRLPPDIPQVYSRPEDPNTVSFLTLLPEVRNRIYELLLQSTSQILIQHPEDTADEALNEEFTDTAEIKKGVAILRACRQVFNEAAGILYGQNTFYVDRSHPFSSSERYSPSSMSVCATWMRNIGSVLKLVRRLVIGMDRSDLLGDGFHHTVWDCLLWGIDIFPIVSILWQTNCCLLCIKVQPRGTNEPWAVNGLSRSHAEPGIVADNLSKAISGLGTKDGLQMKWCRIAIQWIRIKPGAHSDGMKGCVQYLSTSGRGGSRRHFTVDDTSPTSFALHPRKISNLSNLPYGVQKVLMEYLLPPHEPSYDLLSGHLIGRYPPVLQLSSYLRNIWSHEHFNGNKTRLVLRNDSTTNLFTGYDGLGSQPLSAAIVARYDLASGSEDQSPAAHHSYVVRLITTADASLSHVQMSSLGFFRQMSSIPAHVSVTFELHARDHVSGSTEQTTTTLHALVERTFLFLSDLHFHSPQRVKASSTVEVFINGHGIPVYATIQNDGGSQPFKVANTRAHLKPAQVRNMAQGRCQRLQRDHIRVLFDEKWRDDDRDRTFAHTLGHVYRKYITP